MSDWNYNMEEAPRSVEYTVKKQVGKTVKDVKKFEGRKIIATDGDIVTVSWYLPKEDRWAMFATKQTPTAWQPWPDAPSK